MFKRSARYVALALTLVALSATVRTARAQPTDDPCTDPTTGCVVGSSDPQPPTGKVVTTNPVDPLPADAGQKNDDLISFLIQLYGLA